jgi:hypothetical protein
MATTISSGRANSPKKLANIADHGVIYGGRGLVFDGVVDYFKSGSVITLGATQSQTWSAWVYKTGAGGPFCIMSGTGANVYRSELDITSGELIHISTPDGNDVTHTAGEEVSLNIWNHIVVTYNNSSPFYKIYINGLSVTLTGTDGVGGRAAGQGFTDMQYFGSNNAGTGYLMEGKISDIKIFNETLTEAQVQELYLKPEQSAPLAVRDNLVAWYPMAEGNPDSPQSVVYDHSEKGLGSEMWDAPASIFTSGTYAWVAYSNNLIENDNNSLKITYVDNSNGAYQYLRDSFDLSGDTKVGSIYKLTMDAKVNSGSVSLQPHDGSGSSTGYAVTNTDFETYTWYFKVLALHPSFKTYNMGSGEIIWLDNISFKEVKMGNHATTVFYGKMNDLLSSAQETALADALDATNDSFDFATGTTNLVKTDGFTASNATFVNASALGLLTNNASAQGAVSLPIATVAGKTYQVQVSTGAQNSNVAVSLGTSTSYNASNTTGNQAASQTNVALGTAYVADDTSSFLVIQLASSTDTEYANLDNIKVWEVGVTTAGYDTADEEQTIPQVPLMRYNEPMVFDGYDDFVTFDSSLSLPSDFTLSAWIYPDDLNTRIFLGDAAGDDWIRFNSATAMVIEIAGNQIVLTHGLTFTTGELQHLAIVRASDVITVYRNATAGGTTGTRSGTFAPDYIGKKASTDYFDGNINEVSVWNDDLSLAEVQELFNDGVALDATTHSKKASLRGYWRNDGISSWKNRWRDSFSFLECDGSGDIITIGDLGVLTNWSISSWARLLDVNREESWWSSQGDGTYPHASIYDDAKILPVYASIDGSDTHTNTTLSATSQLGHWGHLTVTSEYDSGVSSSTIKVYWNGILATTNGTRTVVLYGGAGGLADFSNLKIGTGPYNDWAGGLVQFGIWNTVLTAAQILALHDEGLDTTWADNYSTGMLGNWKMDTTSTSANAIVDLSGNGNHGTLAGNPSLESSGNNGTPSGSPESIVVREALNTDKDGLGFPFKNADKNVLRLDGAGDYTNVGHLVKSWSAITIEAWIKTTTRANMSICGEFIGSTIGFRINTRDDGNIWFQGGNTSSGAYSLYDTDSASQGAYDNGNWHHIVATKSATLQTLYYDNASVDTTADTTSSTVNDSFEIGRLFNGSEYFSGIIDEVRVYNRALSATEVTKNYKHGKGKHS